MKLKNDSALMKALTVVLLKMMSDALVEVLEPLSCRSTVIVATKEVIVGVLSSQVNLQFNAAEQK